MYNTIVKNDKLSRELKLPYQNLQNLKFLIRSKEAYSGKKYLQKDMIPLLKFL